MSSKKPYLTRVKIIPEGQHSDPTEQRLKLLDDLKTSQSDNLNQSPQDLKWLTLTFFNYIPCLQSHRFFKVTCIQNNNVNMLDFCGPGFKLGYASGRGGSGRGQKSGLDPESEKVLTPPFYSYTVTVIYKQLRWRTQNGKSKVLRLITMKLFWAWAKWLSVENEYFNRMC